MYSGFRFYLFIFRERRREGEIEGEKHQSIASHTPPAGDLACNPGMCLGWDSNQWPFDLKVGTQSTEPHQRQLFSYSSSWTRVRKQCVPLKALREDPSSMFFRLSVAFRNSFAGRHVTPVCLASFPHGLLLFLCLFYLIKTVRVHLTNPVDLLRAERKPRSPALGRRQIFRGVTHYNYFSFQSKFLYCCNVLFWTSHTAPRHEPFVWRQLSLS